MTDEFEKMLKIAMECTRMKQIMRDCIALLESDEFAERQTILMLLKQVEKDGQ